MEDSSATGETLVAWNVAGKTTLVTGATSGIGLHVSMDLAKRGARMVMVGRDPARTGAAAVQIGAQARSIMARVMRVVR